MVTALERHHLRDHLRNILPLVISRYDNQFFHPNTFFRVIMYFSVPLSDSHSSESGSRLFAIRSRIYNSASPDLLSERTWAATHPQRYTKVYYRQLKSPPSEHRHIRQRSHSNRRPFTATCRTVCDLINNAERSTRSICPGAFPSPHREQPAVWRPAPCAPAENPATHVLRPARNPDAPASGTIAPRTSRAPDAR